MSAAVSDDGQAAVCEYDVTAWLLQSSCSLPAGQFLHVSDGSFSLHSAMSALELMDSRMDPGMANPTHSMTSQQRQRVASREEQMQWDDRYVLMCADTLICCLSSHLNGLSLPHSLYTFTLLHSTPYERQHDAYTQQQKQQPSNDSQHSEGHSVFPLLHQPVLRLLSRLTLDSCHACRGVLSRADLYEEEEWNMHDYGISIQPSERGGDALARDATAAEQTMEASSRAEKKTKQQPPQQTAASAGREEEKSAAVEGAAAAAAAVHRSALLDRVRLCHALLLLLSHLNTPSAPLHTAHKLLTRAATHLHAVMHTTVMAPQQAAEHLQQLDAFRESADCPFDPSIAASLILHAPPRLYPLLSFPAALTLLHQLLTHCSLLLASSSLSSLSSLVNFVGYFASQRPNIVLRSALLSSLTDEADVNRSGRSLASLLADALHHLSPSSQLFALPAVRWAVYGPLPGDTPAELRPLPPADLTASWMSHMSTLVLQHFRVLLMDPTRQRRKVGSALQLAVHLQPAAVSVDQWLSLACRRLRIKQADGAWYSMADHLQPQQIQQLEEADRRMLYASSYYALALEVACSVVLHQLVSLFSQQLAVDEELSVLYFALQHYSHCRANNTRAAWRDSKLPSALLEMQQTPVVAAAKKRRGKQQQQQQAFLSLGVTPPATADTLLWDCVALLSAGVQTLIHGLARLKLPSGDCQAVAVPLLPPGSLTTYFSSRFSWLPSQLSPALSTDSYEQQMSADFSPSLDAQSILALSGRLFAQARDQLTALQQTSRQHPPLPACTIEALVGQSSAVNSALIEPTPAPGPTAVQLPSARVVLLSDLSARTVLPFDGAFLHSLTRVAVANAVTAATAAKKATAPLNQSATKPSTPALQSSGRGGPSFRARFSFAVNWLFPVVSVEPAHSRPTSIVR